VSGGTSIAGAVLAGGQSRRMGEDKALLTLAGTPLIERVLDRLRPQVTELILNVHEEEKGLGIYGLPIVTDAATDHHGPLAGILAALRWAETAGIPWVATVAVDTPFFPKDLVRRLQAAAQDKVMAGASSGGRLHPVFGLWKTELAGALERAIGMGLRSARQWVALHEAGIAEWPAEPYDPFFNINQPEDVTTALHILDEFFP
jgi:molybdopterin-guanine dinucleotide biosynthesis protein A